MTTWYVGEYTCIQNGGHLASVKEESTNSFLSGLSVFPFNHTDFWLGGTTNYLGGNWSWTDFTSFTYYNWTNGQPNNSIGYCLVQSIADGKWTSADCTQQKPFICEYPKVQQQTCICPTVPPCASTQHTTQYTAQPSQNPCPNSTWFYAKSMKKCYYYSADLYPWSDSNNICQSLSNNSSLVVIKSNEENNIVYNYTISQNSKAGYIWIGLRMANENYIWVDGSPLNFTNWNLGAPKNFACVYMATYKPGAIYWIDAVCDASPVNYVCEYRL